MNYAGEYTGPYWSNGEIQESVEWGDVDPTSQLDWLSRQHDSAYAHFSDRRHREAADLLYMRESKKLVGKFPELAGNLVGYGNYAVRQASKLGSDIAFSTKYLGLPLAGILKFGIDNIIDSQARIKGTYLKNELSDVQGYYKTDPYKKVMPNPSKATNVALNGSFEKVKAKPTIRLVGDDGQKNVTRIPGWIAKADPSTREARVMSLNAPRQTEQESSQGPTYLPKFLRRKKKNKNKIHVEPLEDRAKRLALAQKHQFEKFQEKRTAALASKPKKKNKAFGFDRTHKIMVQAKNKNC